MSGLLAVTAAAVVLTAVPAAAAPDDDAVAAAVAWLPSYVEQAMEATGVPGVAVAVVHHDRIVLAQGFGVRDTSEQGAVTADTVFQLASLSKPLGATAVAAAIGRGVVRWDTPAAALVPGFSLADPWVTEHVTIGDLYAHRSGLPGGFGNDLETFGYGRQHILERAGLEPLAPFRDTYAYSNFGLTAGAVAAANAAGQSWSDFTESRLFRPLGMTRSTFSHDELGRWSNVASLHQQVRGRWVPGPPRDAEAQAPAGGASSTARDLGRWMRMVLGNGTFAGRRVVAQAPLEQMVSLQIRTSTEPAARIEGYGFGIRTEAFANDPVTFAHSGEFTNGASTQVTLVPELDLGIVTLTNGWPTGVPQAVNAAFIEQVRLGEQTADWLTLYRGAFAPLTTPSDTLAGEPRPMRPAPARALDTYAGTYAGDYVGTATVRVEGGRLVLAVGPEGRTRFPLRHWDADTFTYNRPDLPRGFLRGVRFDVDASGTATSVTLDDVNSNLGVLVRQ